MIPILIPRAASGLDPIVYSNNGRDRRPLLRSSRYVAYHYTGVNRSYRDTDASAHVRHLNQIFATTKRNEYNYVIPQNDDRAVIEFAGKYEGAHVRGSNGVSIGIYFLNGIRDPLTDSQIRRAQWIRDVLIADGTLRPQPEQRPHRLMPNAATSCPGDLILSRMAEIVRPFPTPDRYDPDAGLWSLFPLARKPVVKVGAEGPTVLYLNDALRVLAGQSTCGDRYTTATARGVRNVEIFFGIEGRRIYRGRWTAAQVWNVLDSMALGRL